MATDDKIVCTPLGYGKVLEHTRYKVTIKLHWGAIAYLNPSSVSTSVHFSIKLFSSSRKTLQYEWGISQDFSLLFSLLQKQLALPPNMQLNLLYPKGKLAKVLPSDSPMGLRLKNHTKMIGITKQSFTWDASKKSVNIELLDDLLTVKKKDESEVMFESVLGTVTMTSGLHQWEIKMDFLMDYEEEEEVFIGVANKGIGLQKNPLEIEYWGFMCIGCKKFAGGNNEEYGESIGTGDVVGVKLEFKENKGILGFSKNGVEFGAAFCDVPPGVCPVVTLNYPKIQVSLGKSDRNSD
jgi:hypothetical protein